MTTASEGWGDAPGTVLANLMDKFDKRLPELASEPGLVAAVSQHAAEIRNQLVNASQLAQNPSADYLLQFEDLADYVLGFQDVLDEIHWDAYESYEFAALRLMAVCWLIRERKLAPADPE